MDLYKQLGVTYEQNDIYRNNTGERLSLWADTEAAGMYIASLPKFKALVAPEITLAESYGFGNNIEVCCGNKAIYVYIKSFYDKDCECQIEVLNEKIIVWVCYGGLLTPFDYFISSSQTYIEMTTRMNEYRRMIMREITALLPQPIAEEIIEHYIL